MPASLRRGRGARRPSGCRHWRQPAPPGWRSRSSRRLCQPTARSPERAARSSSPAARARTTCTWPATSSTTAASASSRSTAAASAASPRPSGSPTTRCARRHLRQPHLHLAPGAVSASLQPYAGLADHRICEYPVATEAARAGLHAQPHRPRRQRRSARAGGARARHRDRARGGEAVSPRCRDQGRREGPLPLADDRLKPGAARSCGADLRLWHPAASDTEHACRAGRGVVAAGASR